jgi:hypothetical protein
VGGSNQAHVSDPSGEDSVPELEVKAVGGDNVLLDGAAAPGAAVDAHFLRRYALPIEPAAPNPVVAIAESPKRIRGIACCDHHTIATAQIVLADFIERARLVGDCLERAGDASQSLNTSQLCCTGAAGKSTRGVSSFAGDEKEAFCGGVFFEGREAGATGSGLA